MIFPDIDSLCSESDPQESSTEHELQTRAGHISVVQHTPYIDTCEVHTTESSFSWFSNTSQALCQTAPAFSSNLSSIKHFHLLSPTDWLSCCFYSLLRSQKNNSSYSDQMCSTSHSGSHTFTSLSLWFKQLNVLITTACFSKLTKCIHWPHPSNYMHSFSLWHTHHQIHQMCMFTYCFQNC